MFRRHPVLRSRTTSANSRPLPSNFRAPLLTSHLECWRQAVLDEHRIALRKFPEDSGQLNLHLDRIARESGSTIPDLRLPGIISAPDAA
jgi:hypothetical protein